jgi:hypothetical protein
MMAEWISHRETTKRERRIPERLCAALSHAEARRPEIQEGDPYYSRTQAEDKTAFAA